MNLTKQDCSESLSEYLERTAAWRRSLAVEFSNDVRNPRAAGRENLPLPVVRLHAHSMDWLEAGCEGVCHIEPIGRKALADLRNATTIECSDIYTALKAWDWGFGGDEDELFRFIIDDLPFNIRCYFQDEARRQVKNDRFVSILLRDFRA